MIRNFLVIIIIALTTILIPCNSYALGNQKNINISQIISSDNSNIFVSEKPYQLVNIENNENKDPSLWIASIFIPGLGQMMMGDFGRGIKFTIIAISSVLLFIYSITNALAPGNNTAFLFYLSPIVLLINHIWNIIDGVSMSQDIIKNSESKKTSLIDEFKFVKKITLTNNSMKFELYNF